MRYTGIKCAACGSEFIENDDIVVCPRCGTPEHRGCYAENDGCANESRHEEGYFWQFPSLTTEENKSAAPADASDHGHTKYTREGDIPGANPVFNGGERAEAYLNMQRERINHYKNIYSGVFIGEPPAGGVPAFEAAVYVGDNAEKYIGKFIGMENGGRRLSFNAAALFGPLWFIYRKLYRSALILMLILFGISFGANIMNTALAAKYPEIGVYNEAMIDLTERFSNRQITNEQFAAEYFNAEMPSPLKWSMIFRYSLQAYAIIMASFFANHIYKKKIINDIGKVKINAGDSEHYHLILSKVGGASKRSLFLFAGMYIAINFIFYFI
ncbi:MAG: DUF2628 domain-containing protein [Oscillospiraceae bacterium]|nr:DUF2628 domain-containing protein [Oscillospiraceae bacterium]